MLKNLLSALAAKKIGSGGNFCYPGSHKTIWPKKEKHFWHGTLDGRFQTQFLTAVAKAAA
jgi:hypothetical protein